MVINYVEEGILPTTQYNGWYRLSVWLFCVTACITYLMEDSMSESKTILWKVATVISHCPPKSLYPHCHDTMSPRGLHSTVQYSTVQYSTVQYSTVLSPGIATPAPGRRPRLPQFLPPRTVRRRGPACLPLHRPSGQDACPQVVYCSTVQFCTVQYSTGLHCSTVQVCTAVQYSSVLHCKGGHQLCKFHREKIRGSTWCKATF